MMETLKVLFHSLSYWLFRLLIILFISDITSTPILLEVITSILLDSLKHCILLTQI